MSEANAGGRQKAVEPFRPLSDQEFSALGEEEARAHLLEVRRRGLWTESDRLHGAWYDRFHASLVADAPDDPASLHEPPPVLSANSAMLGGGRALALAGIIGSAVCVVFALASLNSGAAPFGWMLVAYLLSGLGTLGVVFWVAGALEQRLIEIKAALLGKDAH